MQAVIIAAGKSSRFYPFNETHKSLFCVMGKPLISHTIDKVLKSGIKDLVIIVGKSSKIPQVIGDGKGLGIKITYVLQKEPLGAADALLSAKDKIHGEFFLIHPHRVDFLEYSKLLLEEKKKGSEIVLLVKKSEESLKFGFVKVKNRKVVEIIEKPGNLDGTNLRVVGIYLLNQRFLEILQEVNGLNQLEIAISEMAKVSSVSYVESSTDAPTLKYPWDLFEIKNYLFLSIKTKVSKMAKISEKAKLIGEVVVEEGAEISENAVLKGPCFIGKNVFIGTNVLIRNGCDIEEGVKVGAFMELKNSIISSGSTTHSGYIGDSIIGENCKIGSSFDTQNVRLDRGSVKTLIEDSKIDTGRKFLGAIIGNQVIVGGRVSVMPGIIIGSGSTIGPGTSVMENVSKNTLFYTRFKSLVREKKKVI